MPHESFERAVAESRAQTGAALREMLRSTSPELLAKLALGLVPHLFRDYHGVPGGTGEGWAEAIAAHDADILPPYVVRVQLGTFTIDDVDELLARHPAQIALIVIGPPVDPDVRRAFGTRVPWLLDTDGLIHLMITGRVGVAVRVYEAPYVDVSYFR